MSASVIRGALRRAVSEFGGGRSGVGVSAAEHRLVVVGDGVIGPADCRPSAMLTDARVPRSAVSAGDGGQRLVKLDETLGRDRGQQVGLVRDSGGRALRR